MKPLIKLAFASGSEALNPEFIARVAQLHPELPLFVVSEFPPAHGRWIPFHLNRSYRENLSYCRSVLAGSQVRFGAVLADPNCRHWKLRALALVLVPIYRTLFYTETLDHLSVRPESLPNLARHVAWRVRSHLRWQLHPGGNVYTWLWRVRHPRGLRRPLAYTRARIAGWAAALVKRVTPSRPAAELGSKLPFGVSVVIPSRNGRHLLCRVLPGLQSNEIIVVDNGSTDGSATWLHEAFPSMRVIRSDEPLSFARAVNLGIAAARYSCVLLLNNDMMIEPGFVSALLAAFDRVPDLFCATAQIFFPPGVRREETGKAVFLHRRAHRDTRFPVHCVPPIEGEDLTYVAYGSGGCSMYDTRKLRTLGGIGEVYEPAYVEDLDIGYRGWQRGWPTVFVAGAKVVHEHRATTSRYYSDEQLEYVLEVNWLRFLARSIRDSQVFRRLWSDSIERLNLLAVENRAPALRALSAARRAGSWVERGEIGGFDEELIIALGSGDVAVFPGTERRGKPHVLVATCYSPFPLSHGGAVRMYNLMRRAAAEFDQVLVTFVDELHTPAPELLEICTEIVQVRRLGSHVRRRSPRPDVVEEFASPAFTAALHETCRKWRPDLVQLEFTQMAQYVAVWPLARTLLVEHDITFDLYDQLWRERAGDEWELKRQYQRWVEFERQAWSAVDCVVTMSRKDRRTVTGAKRVVTLENGVDVKRFHPGGEPERSRLLFIGSFAHLPNVLAVQWFLREVWPKLASASPVLHVIAGRDHRRFFDLTAPGVEVEDFVPDPRPAYQRATVVIAPLLASAGTNIKIIEAMAMGKAIVSTSAGVNGLDVTNGNDVLVTDTAGEMASAILGLLNNSERRHAIAQEARRTAERRYDWNRIASEQSRLYRSLLSSSRSPRIPSRDPSSPSLSSIFRRAH